MSEKKTDGWTQLRSGRAFDPDDPLNVEMEDLIWGVSHICRFAGHTRRFYSVAEHTVRGAWLWMATAPDQHLIHPMNSEVGRRWLVHDLHEALTLDVPSPFRKHLPDFVEFEEDAAKAVRHRLLWYEKGDEEAEKKVGELDYRMCVAEAMTLMPWHAAPRGYSWGFSGEDLLRGQKDAEVCGLSHWWRGRQRRPAYWRKELRNLLGASSINGKRLQLENVL